MTPAEILEATEHLARLEPALAALIQRVGPMSLAGRRSLDLFGTLARSIVYQQLSGASAGAIFGRLAALFPNKKPSAEGMQKLSDQALLGAGLSRNKLLSLRDLAAKTFEGTLPRDRDLSKLSDEELIERLTQVRGIGPWTVQMLLLFKLGRPDVWPVADLGIQKGFQRVFRKRRLPTALELERLGRPFRPYRSVAAWYFWRAAEID